MIDKNPVSINTSNEEEATDMKNPPELCKFQRAEYYSPSENYRYRSGKSNAVYDSEVISITFNHGHIFCIISCFESTR